MKQSDVLNWLDGEVTTFLSNSSLVSLGTPNDHTGLVNQRDDYTYPFVGIRKISGVPESGGIGGGDIRIDSIDYDDTGTVTAIQRRRNVTLRVECVPVTDGDAKLRDDLGDGLSDHFSLLFREGNHPDDIDGGSVDESTPEGRSEDFVDADGVAMDLTYKRYLADTSVQAAETVNVGIDVSDTPTDDGDDTVAFDESL